MEPFAYAIEAAVRDRHWWFRGRRAVLERLIARLDPPLPPGAPALDVGAGTGANVSVLERAGTRYVTLDASPRALALQGTGGAGAVARVRGDAGRLPFADGQFELVLALDVLEHLDEDGAAILELGRVLRPGGALVIFVPALPLLWGLQDDVSQHRRRYLRGPLGALVAGGGLRVERLTYFNTILFPPILAARLAMRLWRPRRLASENEIGGPVIQRLLGALFRAEAPLLARWDLPVGVSLACVARRPP